MAANHEGNQRSGITRQIVEAVDNRIPSPSERATYIWNLLKREHPDLTDWDVLCFSAEYIGMQHVVHPWLEEFSRELLKLVYYYHYLHSERLSAESIIRREPGTTEREQNSGTEREGDSLRIVKSGEYDGGSG